jgi:hypothetical protein
MIARIWRGWTTPQNANAERARSLGRGPAAGSGACSHRVAAVDAQVLVTGDDAVLAVCQPQPSGRQRH